MRKYFFWLHTPDSSYLCERRKDERLGPQFIDCGTIGSSHISRNDIHRTFLVNEQTVKLSLSEYLVMIELLEREKVATHTLMELVYSCENASDHEEPFSKLLNRLRKKLRSCGLVIRRVSGFGYLLDSEEEQEPVQQ